MNSISLAKSTARLCIIGLSMFTGAAQAANLAEVYELAVKNDPQLAAAEATYLSRKEVVPQARAAILPFVTATVNTTSNEQTSPTLLPDFTVSSSTQSYNTNSWNVILNQTVFNMQRWFQFRQAKDLEAQAMATLSGEQQQLIFRVADSYLKILEAHDRLSAANAERDAVQRQLEQVQQRFDVGLVAITDVLESTAAYDTSTVNVIEAEGAQVISFETLLRLTGQSYASINGLSAEFPVEFPAPRDEEAWVKVALSGNYSLAAAQEAVDAAKRGLHAAKSGHLPTVDARVTYNESTSGAQSVFTGETKSTLATLTLTVPVFSGLGTSSKTRQAGHDVEQADRNLDLTRRTVVENTRSLYTAVNTDVARVNARLRGIESSQSALDATQTGYEVGTRNIVDVLLQQQRLYQAQFQYASARYQYIRDTLSLKQLTGSLGPDDIYHLNEYLTESKTVSKITPTAK